MNTEKELIICSLEFAPEPVPYMSGLIESFTGKQFPEERIDELLPELIQEGLIKIEFNDIIIDLDEPHDYENMDFGAWYGLTEKGREFLEKIEWIERGPTFNASEQKRILNTLIDGSKDIGLIFATLTKDGIISMEKIRDCLDRAYDDGLLQVKNRLPINVYELTEKGREYVKLNQDGNTQT